jgi:CubicO group peptidase (beta-lactamase class C family)
LLALIAVSPWVFTAHTPVADRPQQPAQAPAPAPAPAAAPAFDFATISKLMNDAIAADGLPGGVVLVGHGGNVVFHQAYGSRKIAGEPGLDGSPAPAEPMTEETIFDLASLTKCLATAVAIMQLYEQGKIGFDDPVQKYLPDFNTTNDPRRAQVTVRMLLTNTSGEGIDVSLADPWGLGGPDKAEGIRRALTTPLQSGPGELFRYSDINYILLGALLEKTTGEPEDTYVQRNVFAPLGLQDTRYLPVAKACGPHVVRGAAVAWAPAPQGSVPTPCPPGTWDTSLLSRIAPTARDEESRDDPSKNPNFYALLRGTVHDPTARRMGGVAGNAGVFSTAHDVGIFAQALLDRLADRPSEFPLRPETLELMTAPQQPGHSADQVEAANRAAQTAAAPHYPAVRLGYRHGLLQAARQGLSRRQLRQHRVHRNHAVDGPGFEYLRHPALELDSPTWQPADLESQGCGGDGGGGGHASLRRRAIDLDPCSTQNPLIIGHFTQGMPSVVMRERLVTAGCCVPEPVAGTVVTGAVAVVVGDSDV